MDKTFLQIYGLGPLLEMNHPFMLLQTVLHVLTATKLHLEWKCFVTAMIVHQRESGFITRVIGAWYTLIVSIAIYISLFDISSDG